MAIQIRSSDAREGDKKHGGQSSAFEALVSSISPSPRLYWVRRAVKCEVTIESNAPLVANALGAESGDAYPPPGACRLYEAHRR